MTDYPPVRWDFVNEKSLDYHTAAEWRRCLCRMRETRQQLFEGEQVTVSLFYSHKRHCLMATGPVYYHRRTYQGKFAEYNQGRRAGPNVKYRVRIKLKPHIVEYAQAMNALIYHGNYYPEGGY